jgi:hypothetical protein
VRITIVTAHLFTIGYNSTLLAMALFLVEKKLAPDSSWWHYSGTVNFKEKEQRNFAWFLLLEQSPQSLLEIVGNNRNCTVRARCAS